MKIEYEVVRLEGRWGIANVKTGRVITTVRFDAPQPGNGVSNPWGEANVRDFVEQECALWNKLGQRADAKEMH